MGVGCVGGASSEGAEVLCCNGLNKDKFSVDKENTKYPNTLTLRWGRWGQQGWWW